MNYQDYDVIHTVFEAIEKENMDEACECLCGNFKSVVLKEPVSREEYIEAYRRIKEGIPDAKFRIVGLTSDGDAFKAKIRVMGTHSCTIPPLKRGWKSMKPTNRKINKVVGAVEIVLKADRIIEIRNTDDEKGVIAGLLDELHLLPKNYTRD